MSGRLIAIGDIHGCPEEFERLLDAIKPRKDDRVVLLGDLVNRGPDSHRVIQLAKKHATAALLGNHELRLLNYRKTDDPTHLKGYDHATLDSLDRSSWEYLAGMRLTYEDKKLGVVLVHGGFLPNAPWRSQPARVVTRIQVVDELGEPRKRSEAPGAKPWADLWRGPPFVIYGHTPRAEVVETRWTMGIDTSCVLGGSLTAVILPGFEIVQVRARKRYYEP
ncbi:MAG: Bis(5-nucleosyl)-tetraphosphatase PrpE [Verrucomicrobiota bacterium]|jgi:3',5'-cyclic AMP phosphodiesterase CpdA